MGRKERHDVDYFPFFIKDGRTLFILEGKYQCKGTGFFTNLFRFLSRTPDHHFQLKKESDRLFFFASTKCDEESALDMIDIMVTTGKLDRDLWTQEKVIASQDYLDSIQEAYRKRENNCISMGAIKELYKITSGRNAHISGKLPEEIPTDPIIGQITSPDNPQSKGKERKGKESISKKAKIPLPENFQISPAVYQWAKNKGHTRLDEHLESFKAKCRANGYQYIDWDSAFMEAVRSDWAKLKPTGGNGNGGIRTARSDPRDKTLQSREDAEIAAIIAKRQAAKQSACRDTGGNANDHDEPDLPGVKLTG